MADIFQIFTIKAPVKKVFEGISTSHGLDQWWTKSSQVNPVSGGTYLLDFGPGLCMEGNCNKIFA